MSETTPRAADGAAERRARSEVPAFRPRPRLASRLGELLLEAKAITAEQLQSALEEQKATGLRLGEVLLQRGQVTDRQLRQALATQLQIRFVDLDLLAPDARLGGLIDRDYARRHRVIPIADAGNRLIVAMEDPSDQATQETLCVATGRPIEVVVGTSAAFWQAYGRTYGDCGVAAAEEHARGLAAKHAELVRRLATVRASSERVRKALAAGSRRLAQAGAVRPDVPPANSGTGKAAPTPAPPGDTRRPPRLGR